MEGMFRTKCGHQHARNDLVAIGDEDEAVEGVSHGHDLDGIGDQLTACQRVPHAHVVHGDAVAHADGAEFNGSAPSQADPGFYGFRNFVEMNVRRV